MSQGGSPSCDTCHYFPNIPPLVKYLLSVNLTSCHSVNITKTNNSLTAILTVFSWVWLIVCQCPDSANAFNQHGCNLTLEPDWCSSMRTCECFPAIRGSFLKGCHHSSAGFFFLVVRFFWFLYLFCSLSGTCVQKSLNHWGGCWWGFVWRSSCELSTNRNPMFCFFVVCLTLPG